MKATVALLVFCAIFQSELNTVVARAVRETSNSSPQEDSAELSSEKDTSDSSSEEETSDLTAKEEACVTELQVDRQFIVQLNNEEIAPEDNENFNKFLECYWQKEEWMNSNGEINYDNLLSSLKEITKADLKYESSKFKSKVIKNIEGSVEFCEKNPPPKGDTNGQTAVKVQNCFMSKYKEIEDLDYLSDEDEEMSELSSKEEACVDELHLDKQFITQINNDETSPEDNNDYNMFLACYWQKEEWMDSNGEINYDNVLHSLKEMALIMYRDETHEFKSMMKKRVKRAVLYCQNNSFKGNSYGETVAKLQNCINGELSKWYR